MKLAKHPYGKEEIGYVRCMYVCTYVHAYVVRCMYMRML